MEIKNEHYQVSYDPTTATIVFKGALRLRGMTEYTPIIELLNQAIQAAPPAITLDLADLQFINSSGINMLFRFVIGVREHEKSKLVVRGTKQVTWQPKSLKNLQKLLPSLRLEWDQDPDVASG